MAKLYLTVLTTPQTVALYISLSMEFSRQEYWRRLPLPIPGELPDSGIEPMSLASPALTGRFFFYHRGSPYVYINTYIHTYIYICTIFKVIFMYSYCKYI